MAKSTVLKKFVKLKYVTYFLMFPDGEQWVRQTPFVDDIDVYLKNVIKEHERDNSEWADRARKLWQKNDVWWKDKNGVEHRMVIEVIKRRERWGTKTKFGSVKSGVKA